MVRNETVLEKIGKKSDIKVYYEMRRQMVGT